MAPISQSVTVGSNANRTVCRVVKRDLVASVSGSPTFLVAPFDGGLSPSNGSLFTWLNTIADSFDYIEWNKVKLQFVSSSPSTSAGRVYLCADYNTSDPPPDSASQIMSQQDAVSGGTWNTFELNLSSRELKRFKRYFTKRSGQVPEPADSMPGRVYLAVDGTPTGKIGDLYIEYDVVLTVPSIPDDTLERNRMTLSYVNPTTLADVPNPHFGQGGYLADPTISTKSEEPPLISALTYAGRTGFRLAPRKMKLLINTITEAMRGSGGAATFLDLFRELDPSGFPKNPSSIPSSRWKGVSAVIEDPDATGALTITQSPLNKNDTPIIGNVPGATNELFSNNTLLEYDPSLVPVGKRPPQIDFTVDIPALFSDTSKMGTVVGTPGPNLASIIQSTVSTIDPVRAIGIAKAVINVVDLATQII